MDDANEKSRETLSEDISLADPEKVRKDYAAQAVQSYADLLLGMVKRKHTEWDADILAVIEKAYGVIFAGLAEACAEGSLCVTVERMLAPQQIIEGNQKKQSLSISGLEAAIDLLLEKGLISDGSRDNLPLVFDKDEMDWKKSRIYFQRFWHSENNLAKKLTALCYARPAGKASEKKRDDLLAHLESADAGKAMNPMIVQSNADRRHAITQALANNFTIISGGPGTGKTTAVASVLECLLASDSGLKIALAAPTGKAAGRMLESIEHAIEEKADVYPLLKQKQSELTAHTLHKWLIDPQSNGERPSGQNPFEYDVLVVDEASMIGVELALRTFSAIDPKQTRVILLGDPNQLAAVEPGSVLADLCDAQCPLKDYVATLTVSHRFPADSPLGHLASDIKEGNAPKNKNNPLIPVKEEIESNLEVKSLDKRQRLSKKAANWINQHINRFAKAIKVYPAGSDADDDQKRALWRAVKEFQALAAMRHGQMSVDAINDHAEWKLRYALKDRKLHEMSGRLVIVRKNDNNLEIYNGDVGVVLPQTDMDNPPMVYFGDRNGKILSLAELPQYQPAFGITIHQSQGSEYNNVAVFLPEDGNNPLATKELLYTAITRVRTEINQETGDKKGRLSVFGNTSAYCHAIQTPTQRSTGLNERIKVWLACQSNPNAYDH